MVCTKKSAMNSVFYLISLLFINTLSNCQISNNSQTENEEYQDNVNESFADYGTEGSGDYDYGGSGDYYEYDNAIVWANFPKCCPIGQVRSFKCY